MSGKEDRNTPEEVLEPVRLFLGGRIPLDPCPNKWSTVNPKHACRDGLAEPWKHNAFVNPPWDDLLTWAHKGVLEVVRHRIEVLFWIPCYPETQYSRFLYDYCSRVCYWGRRVNHPLHGVVKKARESGSMWPTQLIYIGKRGGDFDEVFREHGSVFVPVR